MSNKRKLAFILAVILIVTLLAACGGKQVSNEEQEGPKKLVIAESIEWAGLDPYQVDWTGPAQGATAEGFLTMDINTKELVPSTAISFEVLDDDKTIKLTIPEGLAYGNGEPVLPEDIKSSIEWGLEKSPYNWDYLIIQDIEIEGNDVFIKCEDYSSTVMYYMTNSYMPIISRSQIENSTQEELLTQAIPYGLFYIDEFVSGSHVSLKRNENYKTENPNVDNKGPSNIEELEVKFMPDGFSRVNGIKAGEIDIAFDIPAENAEELEKDPNVELLKYLKPGLNYLTLNKDNPLFEDINIRKAIAYAINRDTIASANKDYTKPVYSFIVSGMMDYSSDIAQYYENNYSNNLEEAKELLANAGWTDTDKDGYLDKDGEIFEFSLIARVESFHIKTTTQLMQANFREIGIKANIEIMEKGYLKEKLGNDDYDAAINNFVWPEPISILPYIVIDENNLEHEEYYDMLQSSATIKDTDERTNKLAETQKLLMDEVAFIPLLQEVDIVAYRKDVTGIKLTVDTNMIFNDIDKE